MQQRLEEIDVLRGISALAVVLIHTSAIYLTPVKDNAAVFLLVSALNVLGKFSVQVFIFISGFVLFHKYKTKDYNLREFYIKRIQHVLIPYIFWIIIYIADNGAFARMSLTEAFKFLFISLLTSKIAYHTYFILLILQFYLLFPVIQSYLKKNAFKLSILWWSGIIYFLLLILDYYVTGLGKLHIPREFLAYRSKYFILWYFYFILGAYTAYYYEDIKARLKSIPTWTTALTLVSFIAATLDFFIYVKYFSYDMSYAATPLKPSIFLYTILSILVLFAYSLKLANKDNTIKRALMFISKYSLGLYFAHPLLLKYIFKLHLIPWSIANLIVTYVATIVFTLFLAAVLTKNKKAAILFGVV